MLREVASGRKSAVLMVIDLDQHVDGRGLCAVACRDDSHRVALRRVCPLGIISMTSPPIAPSDCGESAPVTCGGSAPIADQVAAVDALEAACDDRVDVRECERGQHQQPRVAVTPLWPRRARDIPLRSAH
jgi:hypothetical protein